MRKRYQMLVSTIDALLHITCGPHGEEPEVATLHRGEGVYFGLTRGPEGVFFVARNCCLEAKQRNPLAAMNQILHLPLAENWIYPPKLITHLGPVADLHQIRYEAGFIWVLSTREPHLLVFDARRPDHRWELNLSAFVPQHLHHPPKPNHHGDIWHFNSLQFSGNSLHVLAHNWHYGAFAMEFQKSAPSEFFRSPNLLKVTEGLGVMSHDLYPADDGLWILDSENGRLLRYQEGQAESISLVLGQMAAPFPRGLAADAERFFIGCGTVQTERGLRGQGESCVMILDRKSQSLLGQIWLGEVGDVCDLLLLNPRDLTD